MMLYLMNAAQLALPLVTLPYLTRVLSLDAYGVVAYVKSLIIYATLVIEFGFLLSATRDIVQAKENKVALGKIVGRTTEAKLVLSGLAFAILVLMVLLIPILRRHPLFALLSFGPPFLSIFLYDYLFRGLEKMHLITLRFLIMKGTATVLTFIFIKGDYQLLLIPIFDILSSLLAVFWVHRCVSRLGIKILPVRMSEVLEDLKTSSVYFFSDMAGTAFGAFTTLLVGIYLSNGDVAYWGILSTLIAAVQTMYSPICDGVYPHMIETRDFRLIVKVIFLIIPFLVVGGSITFFGAYAIMGLIGGAKYVAASPYLRACVPILVISFFSGIFGWPSLGAINKVRETTLTTVVAAGVQVIGIFLLIGLGKFSLLGVIIVRAMSELTMAALRLGLIYRYRSAFRVRRLPQK